MERTATARIDLQKLQILNDRLALCLDALHQVRMSVHSVNQFGYGQGFAPNFAPGFAPSFAPGFAPNFAHTANPYAQTINPYASVVGQIPGYAPSYGFSPVIPSWNMGSAYGVETRPNYMNGQFATAYAPTTQVW